MSYENISWDIPEDLQERIERWNMHDDLAEFTPESWNNFMLEATKILRQLMWVKKYPTKAEQQEQIAKWQGGF